MAVVYWKVGNSGIRLPDYPLLGIDPERCFVLLCTMQQDKIKGFHPSRPQNVPCILLQLFPDATSKKGKCCKRYKKEKRCKKCPDD
jgi:hypothetical protein